MSPYIRQYYCLFFSNSPIQIRSENREKTVKRKRFKSITTNSIAIEKMNQKVSFYVQQFYCSFSFLIPSKKGRGIKKDKKESTQGDNL